MNDNTGPVLLALLLACMFLGASLYAFCGPAPQPAEIHPAIAPGVTAAIFDGGH